MHISTYILLSNTLFFYLNKLACQITVCLATGMFSSSEKVIFKSQNYFSILPTKITLFQHSRYHLSIVSRTTLKDDESPSPTYNV